MKKKKIKDLKFLILFLLVYLVINFIFNFNIWQDIVNPSSINILTIQGESPIYEFVAERVRLNILSGQNPFTPAKEIMYPFGWNFTLDDVAPINGFYFLFLRPFLSPHQSLMLIVVLGIYFSNFLMFLLLKELGMKKETAFLFGLVYGFTPFISYRVGGHQPYTALYVFPLIVLLTLRLIRSNKRDKFINALVLGFSLALTVLTNLYFSVMIALLTGVFLTLAYFLEKRSLINIFRQNLWYFMIAILAASLFLTSWFIKGYQYLLISSYKTILKPISYIPFSADLFSFIIPSRFNPIYKNLLDSLAQKSDFISNIFEDFTYPGIIIVFFYIVAFFRYSKVPNLFKATLWTSVFFWILTLGPYLKVLGRTFQIPLPYLILQLLPVIQMARAPGRFIVPFIFLAIILAAYLFENDLLKNKFKKNFPYFVFFLVFLLDQAYITLPAKTLDLSIRISRYLKKTNAGPTLTIPFVIRDGLQSIGDTDIIWQPYASLLHGQPIYSVYAGRISPDIFDFYRNNYLFKNLDLIINTSKYKKSLVENLDATQLKEQLDFLDTKNIIIKKDRPYSKDLKKLFIDLGFFKVMDRPDYTLLSRKKIKTKEFVAVDFRKEINSPLLLEGWHNPEIGERWTKGKVSSLLFKTHGQRPFKLHLKAEAIVKTQEVRIYVNSDYAGKINVLSNQTKDYEFDVSKKIKPGFNFIVMRFSHFYKLGELTNNPKDQREVSLNVKYIALEEK